MRLSSTALSLLLATCRTSAFGSVRSGSKSNLISIHSRPLAFTRNLSVGLLPSLLSSSASTCLNQVDGKKQHSLSGGPSCMMNNVLINTRGGSSATTASGKTTVLNSVVVDEAATSEPAAPIEYFRSDYEPLSNIVNKINMDFNIQDGKTTVTSEMNVEVNPNGIDNGRDGDLVLDGDETAVKLLSLQINGIDLVEGDDYELKPGQLIVKKSALYEDGTEKKNALLKTVVEIVPEENTQLSGLYKSGPMYCTQCEAMGFRRITYYP